MFAVNTGNKSWTQTFFLKLFGQFRDIPAKSRDIPPKKFGFSGFRGTYRTFWPPPHSRGRPPPHPKISGPKSLGLGSFFLPDLSSRLKFSSKIETNEILKRDWKFQGSHPPNLYFVGNSQGEDWKFGGAPKERRRRLAEKRLSKRVLLESPFLLCPLRILRTFQVL